jgi:hypothetical protein
MPAIFITCRVLSCTYIFSRKNLLYLLHYKKINYANKIQAAAAVI